MNIIKTNNGTIQFLLTTQQYAAINKKGQSENFSTFTKALTFLAQSI
jgi:hypothetical protein